MHVKNIAECSGTGQKYCRMLQWSILQYFRPALSYHLSFRTLFCLFLSGRLRPTSPYSKSAVQSHLTVLSSAALIICFASSLNKAFFIEPVCPLNCLGSEIRQMSRDMLFPTMWYFDMCRLRRACAASC